MSKKIDNENNAMNNPDRNANKEKKSNQNQNNQNKKGRDDHMKDQIKNTKSTKSSKDIMASTAATPATTKAAKTNPKTNPKANPTTTAKAGKPAKSAKATQKNEVALPDNVTEKFIWLNNTEIQVSPDIQRKLDPERVKEIVEDYDHKIANPIKVSYRDGKYYLFDGLHTRESQVVFNGTDDFPIFCRVYYGLTKEDEARLFAKQFGYSEPVPMINRLRALEVAKDDKVLNFLQTTRKSGFAIDLTHRFANNGRISAVCEAFKVFNNYGAAEYSKMLKFLHKTWAGEKWSISKFMLAGVSRFMKMYEVSEKKFISAFREVTHSDILKEVQKFGGMSRDGAFAAALADIFDRRTGVALNPQG